jgi:hypothetical protein
MVKVEPRGKLDRQGRRRDSFNNLDDVLNATIDLEFTGKGVFQSKRLTTFANLTTEWGAQTLLGWYAQTLQGVDLCSFSSGTSGIHARHTKQGQRFCLNFCSSSWSALDVVGIVLSESPYLWTADDTYIGIGLDTSVIEL